MGFPEAPKQSHPTAGRRLTVHTTLQARGKYQSVMGL